jgi:hypothetical protein
MDTTRNDVETITASLVAEVYDLDGGATPVPTELGYDAADPFAVTVCFRTGLGAVVWTFARDLLIAGMEEPMGDGDVHVWPCLDDDGRAVVVVELCAPSGAAMVGFRPESLAGFVDRTLATVPAGTESSRLDLDAVLADLLAAAEGN